MPRAVGSRKQQIVEVASRLFSNSGYDKVTVKQIAQECGITEPAVYRHFESKERIYVAVLEGLEDRLAYQKLFDELGHEQDVEKLLHALATHIVTFFSLHHDIYRLLLYSALRGHEKAGEIYGLIRGTYQKFLSHQLNRLLREGKIIEKNNEITARCFIGMVFDCALATTLWKGMQGKVYKPEAVITNNVPIYARGLKK